MSEQWCISDGEFFSGCYPSKEAAMSGGMAGDVEMSPGSTSFEVGRLDVFEPHISSDDVLGRICEQAWDECDESAYGWLEDVTDEQSSDLEQRVNKALMDWLESTDNIPTFGIIVDVEEVEVPDGETA